LGLLSVVFLDSKEVAIIFLDSKEAAGEIKNGAVKTKTLRKDAI
jgi:hypothetical protein